MTPACEANALPLRHRGGYHCSEIEQMFNGR